MHIEIYELITLTDLYAEKVAAYLLYTNILNAIALSLPHAVEN